MLRTTIYSFVIALMLFSCVNPLPEKIPRVPTPLPLTKSTHTKPIQINVIHFGFEPQHITISPGTTLVWKNYDSTGHSVGMLEGPQDFGTMQIDKEQSAEFRFDKKGKYVYKCGIHNTHPYVFATIEVK